jgi:hypothetical protein
MIGPVRDVVDGFDLPRDISCSTDVDAISLL